MLIQPNFSEQEVRTRVKELEDLNKKIYEIMEFYEALESLQSREIAIDLGAAATLIEGCAQKIGQW